MSCIKMQASAKTTAVSDPLAPHSTGNFHISDGTAGAHMIVSPRDCLGKESREEAQGSKSAWFQRLKPRDEAVTFEASRTEKERVSFEKTEVGTMSAQLDGLSQNTCSRPQQSLQAETSSALKQQRTIQGNDDSEARSAAAQEKLLQHDGGRRFTNSPAFLPTEKGFGPWVNIGSVGRSEREKVGFPPRNETDAAANGLELGKESKGNPNSAVNILPRPLQGSIHGKTTASALCKPLSPMQNKVGLPPRPPCHKVLGLTPTSRTSFPACGPNKGAFHQVTPYSEHCSAAPVFETQDREVEKHGEHSLSSAAGFGLENSKVIDGRMFNPMWHGKVSTDGPLSAARTRNGHMSSAVAEREIACIKREQPTGSCLDVANGRLLENDLQETACKNVSLSSPSTDLQLKCVDSGVETMTNGTTVQAPSLEYSKSRLWQPQSVGGSQQEKRTVIEQVANASTSATSPWELFIEPAGASKIAREQFVEVYNRARDELKNQRLSQSTGRSLARDLDGGPKLTLGPSGASSNAKIDGKFLKHVQQISGPLQLQGNGTKLDEQNLVHQSILKKQDALTLGGSSQSKQAEGLQRAQLLSESSPISSNKGAIPEGQIDLSAQRMPEGSVVHSRDLRASNHIIATSNGLLSTLDNDMKSTVLVPGAGQSCKKNTGQDIIAALGKRPRVTFEDHGITLASEKISAARPRTQNKPHLWLQRWHSATKYSSNGLFIGKTQVLPDGKGDSLCPPTPSIKKIGDEDLLGVSGHTISDRVKWLKSNSSKVLPSAAAMAIVGTAARQFCASQPEGKGFFAFWSGFGMQSYRRVEPTGEEEKDKSCEKASKDSLDC